VAGKWVTQIDRISEIGSWSGAQRGAAQQSFDMLTTAATGHVYTRGEGVILYYAPNKTA
jgi:hypothetical protein